MGFLDDAAKVAGGALDALGVKGGQAAGDSPEKPERGDSIKKADDGSPRGKFGQDPTGSNVPNPLDTAPIEFIHYSLVHADDGKTFPHNKFTPVDGGRGEPPTGRAIMFRDALEREAIMLHGFLSSGKMVLAEYLKNQGMMGAAVEMVGGLLGGGPSKPKPDPAQLDTYMGKVEGAGAALKPAAIEYKPLHQASADLHQMRANLKQFNKSLREYYLEKDEGKGPLGALDKAVGSIPGPAKVLMTVQKIGFSMFDIYLGIYLETQSKTQRLIELASHQMTLDAILSKYEKHALVFPVWSAVVEPPVTEEEVVEEEQGNQGGGFSKSVDLLEPVKKEAKKVTDKVDQIKKDVYDFAGANADPKETPGTEQLTKIFGTLKGGESGKDAGSATEMTITALNAALKSVGGLPSFMTLPIREITNVNVSLLEEVYKRIMALPIADLKTAPITIDILETAGRRHLEKTLVGIPVKLLASVLPAKLGGGGKDVGFNDLSAQQLITHQIEEKLGKGGVGKIINKVLDVAIGQLAEHLEAVRKKAAAENCLTMEVFLGRLPWFVALMFRNTFFVMWNELVKVAFGPAAGFLDKGFDSIAPGVEKAKDAVDTAEEAKRRAEKLNEVKNEGANVGTGGTNLDKYKDAVEDETEEGKARADARAKQREANMAIAAFKKAADPVEHFPITGRVAEGEGKEVTEEVPSILPEPAAAPAANAA